MNMTLKYQRKLASLMATVGLTATALTYANAAVPRGADILPLAGNCRIGPFHQTAKAGQYNVLCEVMQDSEKCLALIKGHFEFDGEEVTVQPFTQSHEEGIAKGRYCLEVLKRDLGLATE